MLCSWRRRGLEPQKKSQPILVEVELDRPSEVSLEVFSSLPFTDVS